MKKVAKIGSIVFILALFIASVFVGISPQEKIELNSAEAWTICTNCRITWPNLKYRCAPDGDYCVVEYQPV